MRRLALSCILVLAPCVACGACSSSPSTPSPSGALAEAGAGDGDPGEGGATPAEDVSVVSVFDLPSASPTQTLSAIAWSEASKTLFALPDRQVRVVPLTSPDGFKTWKAGTSLPLTGRTSATWDGEGLALVNDVFVAVTDETAPVVERFDATGKRIDAVAIPARFASQAPGNKGLESLTASPSGRYLFTANESALTMDGISATTSKGTVVRILRLDASAGGAGEERAYRTEPMGAGGATGDMGVSELAAVSDDALLVLERGFQPGYGNTVRIFRVAFGSSPRVDVIARLDDTTPVLSKTLVVDLGKLPSDGLSHPATQPSPLLDNYEGMALGPTLADGRRLLFVISDDNASSTQVSRVLVLAVRGL